MAGERQGLPGGTQRKFMAGMFESAAAGVFGFMGARFNQVGTKTFAGGSSFFAGGFAGFAAQSGARGMYEGVRATAAGAFGSAKFGKSLVGEYFDWRKEAAKEQGLKRRYADHLSPSQWPLDKDTARWGDHNPYSVLDEYGVQKSGFAKGYRRFGARSPMEHLRRGGSNLLKGLVHPLGVGINLGMAVGLSGDNIMDPYTGMPRHLTQAVTGEVGFVGGGAIGAALAKAMVPTSALLAPGIGLVVGALAGAEAAVSIGELPWTISQFGNKYGRRSAAKRSQFVDSERAATMRQRSLQSIRRSQMNSRSAFGQEALSYHG